MDMKRRNLIPPTVDVHLPWLKSVDLFYRHYTSCYQCMQACPENIIIKADGGFPNIDIKLGECTIASLIKLFESPENQKPWTFIAIIEQSCLALNQISCRSCKDSCNYNALEFPLEPGKIPHPIINNDRCSGCGACVSPCPSFAISISGNQKLKQTEEYSHG